MSVVFPSKTTKQNKPENKSAWRRRAVLRVDVSAMV